MALVVRSRRGQNTSAGRKGEKILIDNTSNKEPCTTDVGGFNPQEKKTKDCVYSHRPSAVRQDEILNVYDFVGGDSPSQNTNNKKTRKRGTKTKPASDQEFHSSELKKGARKRVKPESEDEDFVPRKSKKRAKERTENKDNISLKRSKRIKNLATKAKIAGCIQYETSVAEISCNNSLTLPEDKENVLSAEPSSPTIGKKKTKVHFQPYEIHQTEGMATQLNETQVIQGECDSATVVREKYKWKTSLEASNKSKKVGKSLKMTKTNDEGNSKMNFVGKIEENKMSFQETTPVREQERNANFGNSDPLQEESRSQKNFLRTSPLQKDVTCSRNGKQHSKKRICVENFTAENYFGFDETDDDGELSFSTITCVGSSTPYSENKPTRLNIQLSRAPRYATKKRCKV